jgi:predicted RND superfamily exporter protein
MIHQSFDEYHLVGSLVLRENINNKIMMDGMGLGMILVGFLVVVVLVLLIAWLIRQIKK